MDPQLHGKYEIQTIQESISILRIVIFIIIDAKKLGWRLTVTGRNPVTGRIRVSYIHLLIR